MRTTCVFVQVGVRTGQRSASGRPDCSFTRYIRKQLELIERARAERAAGWATAALV